MTFLNEFATFVGDLVTAHDRILLLGDFVGGCFFLVGTAVLWHI